MDLYKLILARIEVLNLKIDSLKDKEHKTLLIARKHELDWLLASFENEKVKKEYLKAKL